MLDDVLNGKNIFGLSGKEEILAESEANICDVCSCEIGTQGCTGKHVECELCNDTGTLTYNIGEDNESTSNCECNPDDEDRN